ncbi:glycosyl hydrolase family 92-domain-containing protein [Aspergillus leporis]|uniref:Glycosyl hydrolase family 92-domain-containing protein n=1 Tax=Aspergillus leporis TaxID=41062 RepID=A0A5N5WYC6_9EURO|nr:glycosyl hydrolase family 92-domain-containing protein [Aspergillus leporis]
MRLHILTTWLLRATALHCLSPAVVEQEENASSGFDVFSYIDPFIGTSDGGHSFPGATLPFGMAKGVADTDGANQGGFASDARSVTGFSHTHDSGTGGPGSMGSFPIFVHPSCPDDNLTSCAWLKSDRVVGWTQRSPKAQPGFFSISLRMAFSFLDAAPESLNPVVLVDINGLHNSRHNGTTSVNPRTGQFTGTGTFEPSYEIGTYTIHFCADFKRTELRDTGSWIDNEARPGQNTVSLKGKGSGGTFTRFKSPGADGTITVRVGVSFMSITQACSNAETEQPDFDFEGTVAAAKTAWKEKMDVVSLDATGVSTALQTVFWCGIYRTMISPQDYTGENPLWESDEPYYDSFYCIWDSFRGIHQLITLLDPLSQSRMIRSLVDIYRYGGFLPDCRMSLMSWQSAELEHPWIHPNPDANTTTRGLRTRSISRTVGYAYNDFCITQMAKRMGHDKDYKKYMQRATNWKNVFKPNQTSSFRGATFTGFLQPRNADRAWTRQDPMFCGPYLRGKLLALYIDMGGLIAALGGRSKFVSRLSFFHDSGLLNMGNEQAFLPVFLFHYAGRPTLSTERAHSYIPRLFNTTIGGIPGNDDSGAMGSFAVLSMIGLFPVHGQDVYLISPPFFREVNIRNKITGNRATIRNINFDPTYKSVYVQKVTRDGKPWTKNWVGHDFFTDGGTLEITLGSKESNWGYKDPGPTS